MKHTVILGANNPIWDMTTPRVSNKGTATNYKNYDCTCLHDYIFIL